MESDILRSYIIQGDQVGYSNVGRTVNYPLWFISYDFDKVFLVIWVKRYLLEKHLIFKAAVS